mgnify:CR=1 FL=1
MDSLLAGIGPQRCLRLSPFFPPLVMSLAARSGHLQWIGSEEALSVFAVATFFEVAAYYVPWVDNPLDVVATPVAVGENVTSLLLAVVAVLLMALLVYWLGKQAVKLWLRRRSATPNSQGSLYTGEGFEL